MADKISKAETKEEIIDLIHPELIKKIPASELDEIAANILAVEKYFRGVQYLTPDQVNVTRIYNHATDEITQIDNKDKQYKLS